MIQFERTNDKGEKLRAYTHVGYLSKHYVSEVTQAEDNARIRSNVIAFGASILTYWALNNVPQINAFVRAKLPWKGGFLLTSFLVGQSIGFDVSFILRSSIRSKQESLLKNQVFPAWFRADRVVNPDRVFFELDDNNHNEPNIWHSGISQESIRRILPDFIVGNPHKPHAPVADHHHH